MQITVGPWQTRDSEKGEALQIDFNGLMQMLAASVVGGLGSLAVSYVWLKIEQTKMVSAIRYLKEANEERIMATERLQTRVSTVETTLADQKKDINEAHAKLRSVQNALQS